MKVSIIIPAYNLENYIERSIKSCIEQTYADIEIIVVNDGSTDKTGEIINSLSDYRLIKIDQCNQGVSSARNSGLEIAKGDFCIFLDGDDWLEKEAICSLMKTYKREKCLIVSTYKDAYFQSNKTIIVNDESILGVEGRYQWKGYRATSKPFFRLNSACYKLFDMKVIRENKLKFDNSIQNGEDGLFVCCYLQYVKDIYYLPYRLWVIFNRPDSATRVPFNRSQLSIFKALGKMQEISTTVNDKNYFEWCKCEKTYYLAWRLIISKNHDYNLISEMKGNLMRYSLKFLFGPSKFRKKIKYLFMMLWYVFQTINLKKRGG